LIVRDARSLRELFHLLGYEGHPSLWYLLLRPLTYLTGSPTAMQVLHGVISTVSVYVFARFSPFTRLQKVLWCFGYYSLFEYGVISRNYGLGALLLWTICAMWPRRRGAVIAMAIVLALLVNTNAFAALIAASIALVWLGEAWWRRSPDPAAANAPDGPLRWVLAVAILIAAYALSAWTVYPAQDAILRPKVTLEPDARETRALARHAALCFADIWQSYVPMPNPTTREFWNTNILPLDTPMRIAIGVLLSAALLAAVVWTLRRSRAALAIYLIATALLGIGTTVLLPDSMRHVGHLALVFVACSWIARRDRRPARADERAHDRLLTALLAAQFVAGMWAMAIDARRPFSSGDEAARWLRKNGLADAALVGDVAHRYSPLVARLDTRIYYPVRRAWGSSALLDQTKKEATDEEVDDACRALLRGRRPVVLITAHPRTDAPGDLRYEPLASFTGSITRESYHLYRVGPADGR
jgi:hypothetical protein